MNYILFDNPNRNNLLPLTFTRPVADLRVGILTIREKWEKYFGFACHHKTSGYLSEKYSHSPQEENCLLNGSVLPSHDLIKRIKRLENGQSLVRGNILLAIKLNRKECEEFNFLNFSKENVFEFEKDVVKINFVYDIFLNNDKAIDSDFELITRNRKSHLLSKTNNLIAPENIFVEEGVKAEFSTLNASTGKIYLGKKSEIMEGSVVRGSLALCEGSTLKLGTRIYGATTIGPFSKVGGEINNSVIFGYSNKAHDGFLGNAVLGEWCNLGAGTSNSNLKNNYAEIKLWSYPESKFVKTGLRFCGLIMGDHTKCGINTMFNTGTVVGVCSNIYGSGFPRNFIPSFSWGGAEGFTTYALEKVLEVAKEVMERRNIKLEETEIRILTEIFKMRENQKKVNLIS